MPRVGKQRSQPKRVVRTQRRLTADGEWDRLHALFQQAPAAVCVLRGPELIYEMANAQYLELTKREVVGRPLLEVFPELRGQEFEKVLWKVQRTRRPVHCEERLARIDRDGRGEVVDTYWTYSVAPLHLPDGVEDRVFAYCHDVTALVLARRRIEERTRAALKARRQAEQAAQAKDDFLAMLGHELRNPLTPILATLQLMRLQETSVFVRERELIERQARLLAKLVDDLMDTARIARGKVELVRARVDLAAVVSRAAEGARSLIQERGHALRLDLAPGLRVNGDEARLVQVFSNILNNAARYTPAGGRIEVVLRLERESAVLDVRDSGVGIAPELLPHVFEPFRQGAQGSERSQGGLGLGLSIASKLVAMHGGRITAQSAGPGQGSTFTVYLPAVSSRRPTVVAAGVRRSRGGQPVRAQEILLVDDNRDITHALASLLRTRGHRVSVAHDGPSALAAVERFLPRFALLDIGLPVMNGYELAGRLKKKCGVGLSLIALTGYGLPSDRRKARKAGFHEHLVKPIDVERLFSIVEAG
jgi:PAS domain S-box-containing protein